MLVVAWDALYEAIPTIQAKESLAAYTSAVLASPSLTEEGQAARDGILDNWRKVATHGWQKVSGYIKSTSDFSGKNTPEGAMRDDAWFPSVRSFGKKMADVLGIGLRD